MPSITIEQAFKEALGHHQTGKLAEAEAIYRQILAVEPHHAGALFLLGIIANQVGRIDDAVRLIRQAIRSKPDFPEAHYNLGNLLKTRGQSAGAIAAYRQAIALKPDYVDALNSLGNTLIDGRRWDDAISVYRQAIAYNRGAAGLHYNLGNALKEARRGDEAIAAYRQAIALQPDFVEALTNLGVVLKDSGQLDEAIAVYRHVITVNPGIAEAHFNLGNALKETGQLDEAIAAVQKAITLNPGTFTSHSILAYSLLFQNPPNLASIRAAHDELNLQFGEPLRRSYKPHKNDRNPSRRLRVGYVSPNFSRHVICHFLTPLLETHDHSAFEIYCYSSVRYPDAITERMKRSADIWREVVGMRDEMLVEQIRADKIDILVDLAQHMAENRLLVFAHRPAPVQISWLGYPGSTGFEAIDYRITDAFMEPEGSIWSASHDTPIRLPDCWFCFDPIDDYPEPTALPALRSGYITFGSLNNFCKLNEAVLQLWAQILKCVEGSRLLMQCPSGATQSRVRQWFAARGIEANRLEMVDWVPNRAEFLRLFERIDIALEPFPYNGGTSTCEALWMGIPVPTFPGSSAVSRIGLSILLNAGLPELVAPAQAEYLQLVVDLTKDLKYLTTLRSTLRDRMKSSVFMDAPRFARNIEHAYRQTWIKWCEQEDKTGASV